MGRVTKAKRHGNIVDRFAEGGLASIGLPGVGANQRTWEKTYAWERAQANQAELAEREPEMDRVKEAIVLYETNAAAAFQIWFELAQRGSVWSMLEIARCYEYGKGIARDIVHAEHWYSRALGGGSQIAMLNCAGLAAARNDLTACEAILEVGVRQDWVPAIFWLAWYRLKQSESRATYRQVRPMLENAAQRGHPAAQWLLVRFMARGKFGLREVPRGLKLSWDRAKVGIAELEAATERRSAA